MKQRHSGALTLAAVLTTAALACSSKTPSTGHPTGAAGTQGAAGAGGGAGGAGTSGAAGGGAAGSGGAGAGVAGTSGAAGTAGAAGAGNAGAGGTSGGAGTGADAGPVDAPAGDAPASMGTGCKGATVCYDFDDCKLPAGWKVQNSQGNQGAGMTLVDNAMPHSGTCALHMKDYTGDSPQHSYLADLPASFGPVMWGRAFIYTTSAPTNHGALVKARYAIQGSGNQDWYEIGYELKNYNSHWHNPLPPSGLPEWIMRSTKPIAANKWECVEWLWDAGNGGMAQAADPRMWVDGEELTWGSKLQYDGNGTKPDRPTTPSGTNFVTIEVGLTMYHPVDEKMQVYFDELAFGKQRIGCNP
jgi:hypothetical protein